MTFEFREEIVGEYIILRKVTLEDAQDIFTWRTGLSGKYLRSFEGYNIENQKKWISCRSDDEINYIIYDKFTDEKVGTISIYDVNDSDKIANVGRLLLREDLLNKSNPYGLESLKLGYSEVFHHLQFRKITGDIFYKNDKMITLQKFLGMKEEGVLKNHCFIDGDFGDLHILSIFNFQFSSYSKKIDFLLKSFKKINK